MTTRHTAIRIGKPTPKNESPKTLRNSCSACSFGQKVLKFNFNVSGNIRRSINANIAKASLYVHGAVQLHNPTTF